MLRHFDQDARQTDGPRHWDSIKSLVRKFAYEGARDFSDEAWLQKIFEGSTKKRIEYCEDKHGILGYFRAIQGHSGGIPMEPELMGYVFILRNLKSYTFHRGLSWTFQSILGHGLIPGGKRKIKPVRQSFKHQRILLEMTERKKSLMMTTRFHRKYLS